MVVLLGVVFVSNYTDNLSRSRAMLERYVALYSPEHAPSSQGLPPGPPDASDTAEVAKAGGGLHDELLDGELEDFRLSSFYSVSFDDAGGVLLVDVGHTGLYTSDNLVQIARDTAQAGFDSGTTGALLYRVEQRDGYTLVAFIDNSFVDASMRRLFAHMLLGAGVALLAIFAASFPLSTALVRPLEENDAQQRRFVSDAGHELKTPISVVGVNAEILERQIGKNKWLDNISYENQRMGALVNQLLCLSSAQNREIVRQDIDLSNLVAAGVVPFEGVAAEQGLVLACSIQNGLWVEGDPSQLAQLPPILLDNAIAYARGSQEVSLTLRAQDDAAVLEVINGAEGLDGEVLDHAFERFFRADEARSDAAGRDGSTSHYGLGLPIAKAIAESHGGSIALSRLDDAVHAIVKLPLRR